MVHTFKVGRKPNIINIPYPDMYKEMFTTDLDRIKEFIAVSDYPDRIDPYVIHKINEKAVKLSKRDFSYYFEEVDIDEQFMMYLYENIITASTDKKINRIIKKLIDPKKKCTEEDILAISCWESSNHSMYCTNIAIESGKLILQGTYGSLNRPSADPG
jgi:hypothetical protein